MSSAAVDYPRYTAKEYYEVTAEYEELTELINGYIVDMASPNIRHNRIAQNLLTEMKLFVRQNGGKCQPFGAPTDVRFNDYNIVVPDVFVACDPDKFTKQYHDGAPDFVAEVVSTNRSNDYVHKLWLYQSSGVREYWIIDPKTERVHVYFFEDMENSPEIYDFHTPIPVHIWEGKLTVTIADLYA